MTEGPENREGTQSRRERRIRREAPRREPRREPAEQGEDRARRENQAKREKTVNAAREALKLAEQNKKLKKLNLDQQIAEAKDDLRSAALLEEEIQRTKRIRNGIGERVATELEIDLPVTSIEAFALQMQAPLPPGADKEVLEIFQEEWLEREKALIAAKSEEKRRVVEEVESLINRRVTAPRDPELSALSRGGQTEGIVVAGASGAVYEEQLANLLEELEEGERTYLGSYYDFKTGKALETQAESADWGRLTREQQSLWLDQRIRDLRNLSLDPALLQTSRIWRELTDRLSDTETDSSVRDKFQAHFNLLKFNLGVRRLKDPTLAIPDLQKGLEVLDKTTLFRLFESPEIQTAYDLLAANPRSLSIKAGTDLDELIGKDRMVEGRVERSLIAQYCKARGVDLSREKIENVSQQSETEKRLVEEAQSSLYEAFDLYYFFGSTQAIEASSVRPDCLHKIFNIHEWMRGKFSESLIENYARERYYRKKGDRLVSLVGEEADYKKSDGGVDKEAFKRRLGERQSVGLAINKPLHALFSELDDRKMENLGFKRYYSPGEIFDFRGDRCLGYSDDGKKLVPGTYTYEYDYKDGKGESKKAEVEVLFTKKGLFTVVRVAGIGAEVLAKVFRADLKTGENWIGGYAKNNLAYGENTRGTSLKLGLWSDPAGTAEGELKDPLLRLSKAFGGGEYYQNLGSRAKNKETRPFEICNEDVAELYLDGVLRWSRKEGKGDQNFVVGGDSYRSVIINEAQKKGMISEEGEFRLSDNIFGSMLGRYIRSRISSLPLVAAMRYPGMKGRMFWETLGGLWDALTQYVFGDSAAEGFFGGGAKKKKGP